MSEQDPIRTALEELSGKRRCPAEIAAEFNSRKLPHPNGDGAEWTDRDVSGVIDKYQQERCPIPPAQ